MISEGQVRTQELAEAEQILHRQEIPPKIQTCLLTTAGVFALCVLVGALFRARIGVVVSALGIFPIIGAFHQINRYTHYEREINTKLEQVSAIFTNVCTYLDALTGEKARKLIEGFNKKNLSSTQDPFQPLEELQQEYKNDEYRNAPALADLIYNRDKPSIIPEGTWRKLQNSCTQCCYGTNSSPGRLGKGFVAVKEVNNGRYNYWKAS